MVYLVHLKVMPGCVYIAAVYHNDCMYVAHHLMLLPHQFTAQLPPSLGPSVNYVDLVPVLRRSGTQCFMQQMSLQKTQLILCLNAAHGISWLMLLLSYIVIYY